ncbi:MAG: hypothetical protein LBK61_11665 [Spirochaetaceae bacterium]|jgi:hypothetical protein|nr:hypothetical protein [Spirochaetaceae bacterium]
MKHLDGHLWGDQYASRIVSDGPLKNAEEYVFAVVDWKVGRGVRKRGAVGRGGGVAAVGLAMGAEGRPHAGETARNNGSPPGLVGRTAPAHV